MASENTSDNFIARLSGHGLVFDVKRYAINDGPGIRVALFFKGCNLCCAWCHNPEGIGGGIEKMYSAAKCIGCGTCVSVCPSDALTLSANRISTDFNRCTICGKCADVCPTKAFEMSGKIMSVSELMEIIEKERVFIDQSGGGVTFSGGEPLLQPEILIEALDECGKRGIHRAIDTSGFVKTETILEVAKHTDLFLYDLKLMDSSLHEQWTGVGNELILSNLRAIALAGSEIIIRIPFIGGVNDDGENIRKTAAFIASLPGNRKEVHLLPYHAIAQHKYAKLGKPEEFTALEEPDSETLNSAVGIFNEYDINTQVGG
ncbi:MAG: glycyl-radical enzyme activating protein [Bacteroidetes bacterium]|nr:glycyl-radical enzyme activating protein [Bacteroidota bacterium]